MKRGYTGLRRWWPAPAAAASLGLLISLLGGSGGFSLFSSQAQAQNNLSTGTVTLELNSSTSSPAATWTLTNGAPADVYEAPVTLTDSGSIGMGTISLGATGSSTTNALFSTTGVPSGQDAVYLYVLDCEGGTWTQTSTSAPYSPYTCTPPSGSTTTPTVVTVLGATPACASSTNAADLSPCETSSYWMSTTNPTGYDPTGVVGLNSSGDLATTALTSLPTVTGATGVSEVLAAGGSIDLLLVEYVNPAMTNAGQGLSGDATYTFTGTQRTGTLRS
jgi:hypothetical protein